MANTSRNPKTSLLAGQSDRDLLVKILCELRVQTMIQAQVNGINDDLADLRDEVMTRANTTKQDV